MPHGYAPIVIVKVVQSTKSAGQFKTERLKTGHRIPARSQGTKSLYENTHHNPLAFADLERLPAQYD
jgi:hypothetical protein